MLRKFFVHLFRLPAKTRKTLGNILLWIGVVQFLVVMLFANWHKIETRFDPVTTFFGLPIWVVFVIVGGSVSVTIVFVVIGFFLKQEINN